MIKKVMIGMFAATAMLASSNTNAQTTANTAVKTETIRLEQGPEYVGGESAMNSFIAENLKYPTVARESKVQGNVKINVLIDTDGKIIRTEVARGIGGGCDEEALRIVGLMKFKNGALRGVPTKMMIGVPVTFRL